jgi:hypothetical protein
VPPGEQRHDVGAGVVAGSCIVRARVAESDGQQVRRCPRPRSEQALSFPARAARAARAA